MERSERPYPGDGRSKIIPHDTQISDNKQGKTATRGSQASPNEELIEKGTTTALTRSPENHMNESRNCSNHRGKPKLNIVRGRERKMSMTEGEALGKTSENGKSTLNGASNKDIGDLNHHLSGEDGQFGCEECLSKERQCAFRRATREHAFGTCAPCSRYSESCSFARKSAALEGSLKRTRGMQSPDNFPSRKRVFGKITVQPPSSNLSDTAGEHSVLQSINGKGTNALVINEPPLEELQASDENPITPIERGFPAVKTVDLVTPSGSAISQKRSALSGFSSVTEPQEDSTTIGALYPLMQRVKQASVRQELSTSNKCNMCRGVCTCLNLDRTADIIICSGDPCSRKEFDSRYLIQYCGIFIEEARNYQEEYGFWRCPECSKRNRRTNQVFFDGSVLNLRSRYGHDTLQNDEIRTQLFRFSSNILRYVNAPSLNSLSSNIKIPIMQISCISNEPVDQVANPLADVLRRLLEVSPGVLIKDVIVSKQLQEVQTLTWVRWILAFLLGDFIFMSPSPFEDLSLAKKSLAVMFSSEAADIAIQDIHIKTIEENSTSFSSRMKDQLDRHVRQLNAVMNPLVGCSEELHKLHTQIAGVAVWATRNFAAYTGTYKQIRPAVGTSFNLEFHRLSNPENTGEGERGRLIQATILIGVMFSIPGSTEWRICSKAVVELYPSSLNV